MGRFVVAAIVCLWVVPISVLVALSPILTCSEILPRRPQKLGSYDHHSTRPCFFPVEIIQNIRTPVFLVNPAYDFWQIQNVLVPARADPTRIWQRCRLNIQACSPSQLKILQGFRASLLKASSEFQNSSEGGLFINSCYIHCQTWSNTTWHSPTSPRINNKTIAESVGDWYFERSRPVKEIDGQYPCNPSCVNMDFT